MVFANLPRALVRTNISPARIRLYNSTSKLYLSTITPRVAIGARVTALSPYKPSVSALVRYASDTKRPSGIQDIDRKHEAEISQRVMRAHPERVSGESTTHPLFHELSEPDPHPEPDMLAGIRSDLKTIGETFTLKDVPKDALYLGLAGVVPYLATSLSTVYMAWDLNHAAQHGTGVLLDASSAMSALAILEPLQIGYGAVIISFLGAIHWGLEWASYGGRSDRTRYAVGVLAPAIAWPSVLMPVEYALITQFLAFNFLYFQDAKASNHGTAPPWYATFRFVLTFIVGASIVATLIGRGQIVAHDAHPQRPSDRLQQIRESQMQYLQEEDEEKKRRAAEEEEEGGDDEDEESEDKDEDEE